MCLSAGKSPPGVRTGVRGRKKNQPVGFAPAEPLQKGESVRPGGLWRGAEPAGSDCRISHSAGMSAAEAPTLLRFSPQMSTFAFFFSFFDYFVFIYLAAGSFPGLGWEIVSSGELTHVWRSRGHVGGIKSQLAPLSAFRWQEMATCDS